LGGGGEKNKFSVGGERGSLRNFDARADQTVSEKVEQGGAPEANLAPGNTVLVREKSTR